MLLQFNINKNFGKRSSKPKSNFSATNYPVNENIVRSLEVLLEVNTFY